MKKYNPVICNCSDGPHAEMEEDEDGSYVDVLEIKKTEKLEVERKILAYIKICAECVCERYSNLSDKQELVEALDAHDTWLKYNG